MTGQGLKIKSKEWFKRYVRAEILGTLLSLMSAWLVFSVTHSYIIAAAVGWVAEGVGFYGYFVTTELLNHSRKYQDHSFIKRVSKAIALASTGLFVEFAPAEILDNFFIRPFAMYLLPQYIHPYPVGFLVGKFSADVVFYLFAIGGYEIRKKWLKH